MKGFQTHALGISLVYLCLLSTNVAGRPLLAGPPLPHPIKGKNPWDSFQNFTGHQKGERVDGLSDLKKYLHEFGYMSPPSNSSSNFTNKFDDSLESAIKQYQKNFNLNATGQLDNSTVERMTVPRCGNADIVNGTNTMNSRKPASHSSNLNLHTISHYTFFEGKPSWPENQRNLTYAFLPGNNLEDNTKEVFARAFQRWAAVTPLTFTEIDSYLKADVKIGFFTGDHGDGEAFDGSMGTLAHAFSPTAGLFHLDNAENWVIDGDVTTSTSTTAIDLESVAVHEIGHVLGMGHSSVEGAIMYPSIAARVRKTELASDDIDGIQELYGSNPNYNSSSTPSTTQKDSSDGGVHIKHSQWTMILSVVASFVLLL